MSVIYLIRMSPHGLSILPSIGVSRTGYPQTMVYMNLQPPDGTARRSPDDWWSFTPPSHPFQQLNCGGYFLLPYPTVANSFYFRKWSALRCPDFPLVYRNTSDKPNHWFRDAKVTFFLLFNKINAKKESYIACNSLL